MKSYLSIINFLKLGLVSLLLSSCGDGSNSESNMLSETEKNDGWQLLFDGQNIDQWRGYGVNVVPEKWVIDDGSLFFDPAIDGSGGDIMSKEQYGQFELKLDWKVAEGSNSGVFYHVVEDEKFATVFYSAPEMQILDNDGHSDGEIVKHRAGDLYDLIASSVDATKSVGEWNEVYIKVKENHLEHWLNGQKIVETDMWNDSWKMLISDSKFANWPEFAQSKTGHIALQDHGDPVWFRNIKIKRLD